MSSATNSGTEAGTMSPTAGAGIRRAAAAREERARPHRQGRRVRRASGREPGLDAARRAGAGAEGDERLELVELFGRRRLCLSVPGQRSECLQDRCEPLDVCVRQPCDLGGDIGRGERILERLIVGERPTAGTGAGSGVGEENDLPMPFDMQGQHVPGLRGDSAKRRCRRDRITRMNLERDDRDAACPAGGRARPRRRRSAGW